MTTLEEFLNFLDDYIVMSTTSYYAGGPFGKCSNEEYTSIFLNIEFKDLDSLGINITTKLIDDFLEMCITDMECVYNRYQCNALEECFQVFCDSGAFEEYLVTKYKELFNIKTGSYYLYMIFENLKLSEEFLIKNLDFPYTYTLYLQENNKIPQDVKDRVLAMKELIDQ
jgi:hypothetical protein